MNIDYKKLRGLLLIFLGQFLAYGIVVVNTRSFTTDNYILTAISDMLLASLNFYIIRRIVRDEEATLDLLFYVAGGVVGSLVFMYISKHYLNI